MVILYSFVALQDNCLFLLIHLLLNLTHLVVFVEQFVLLQHVSTGSTENNKNKSLAFLLVEADVIMNIYVFFLNIYFFKLNITLMVTWKYDFPVRTIIYQKALMLYF